jgi:hypothetical protein
MRAFKYERGLKRGFVGFLDLDLCWERGLGGDLFFFIRF